MDLFIDKDLPPKEIKAKQHPWARTIKGLHSHRIKHAHNSIRNPKYPIKEEEQPDPDRVQFAVIGDRVTKEFTFCKNLVIGLHKYKWKNFDVPIIKGCSSTEWPDVWHDLKIHFRGDIVNCLQSSVAVIVNGKILGGEKELQQLVASKYYYHLCLDYFNEGVAEFARFIRSSGRPFAYMHVSIDDTHIGTLIFMLYVDIVPYTCENFLRLCKEKKGGYGGTPVHRIVKDGWIQCGGFGLKSTPLGCENFIVPFDKRGVLAMTNDGRDDDCSTQFFVLLQPAAWMNHKYVAFGQLIEGAATLEKIETVTTWYESPTSSIILYRCGILNMECHDIMINRGANEYIDGHTEDLNVVRKLIWERILETVFLNAQLREIERLKELHGEDAEDSPKESDTEKFGKTAEDFALKVKESEIVREEKEVFKSSSGSLVVEAQRPYYIPLTDVPYPGDVESDFDLKRFLKGDYCLECDLDVNAYKKAREKGNKESFLFSWFDDESISSSTSDQISLNSEQQKELDEYLKENVDRVSFAGGVVKNIAKMSTKATTDIFSAEKRRPSAYITDEKLRQMKLATADMMYRERRHTKVSIVVPDTKVHKEIKRRQTGFVTDEDLERIRVFSRQYFGEDSDDDNNGDDNSDDDDDNFERKHSVHIDPGFDDSSHTPRRIQRRPTGFVRSSSLPSDDDDDDDDDEDEVVHFATQALEKSAPSEALRKRRPTTFVRTGALPIDDSDSKDGNDDNEKEPAPQSNVSKPHFSAELPEAVGPSEALKQRRPTSFVPGEPSVDDDDAYNDTEPATVRSLATQDTVHKFDEEPSTKPLQKSGPKFVVEDDKLSFKPDSHAGALIKHRRPTSYVRPGELPVDDDATYDDTEPATVTSLDTQKTGLNFAEEPTTKPLQKFRPKFDVEDDKPFPKPASHEKKRRATVFVPTSDIRVSDDVHEPEARESVLARLYDKVNNDDPGPTLKNYKPAEFHYPKLLLTQTSRVRHTSEESRLESRVKYHQHTVNEQESFDQFLNLQHGSKLEHKLSSEYVKTIDKFENRFSLSIGSMEYNKRRPTITVSQYQLMNRQYQQALDRKTTPL